MHTATQTMPQRRRRKIPALVRVVMTLSASLIILVLSLVLYVAVSERAAERKAIAFCLTVKVGESPAGLLERAKAAGASAQQSRWTQQDSGEQELAAVFVGASAQSHHVCSVQAKDAVTRADYLHFD